ncbi:MAG TPA: hypothetical protein DCK79_08815 [Candidatus Atribacteria bacterium]|nr:hypothetical protein [Candidatus Atribacteria bacterium]
MSENTEKKDKDIKIAELCRVPREDEALAIKSLLASYNIECILQSDITRSVYPFTIDGLAEVSILVSERDLEKSKEIISKNIETELDG